MDQKGSLLSIAIDSSGNKWIGTSGGFWKFNDTIWTAFNIENSGLPDNYVTSVVVDGNGSKWIGTTGVDRTYDSYGGLAVFSGGNSAIKMNRNAAVRPLAPLCWNYPNPFKQRTLINYNVLESGLVNLRIYSLDGHLIQTLVNVKQTTGHYSVFWDGKNDAGKLMSHGVYLCRLTSNGGIISKKMNFIE